MSSEYVIIQMALDALGIRKDQLFEAEMRGFVCCIWFVGIVTKPIKKGYIMCPNNIADVHERKILESWVCARAADVKENLSHCTIDSCKKISSAVSVKYYSYGSVRVVTYAVHCGTIYCPKMINSGYLFGLNTESVTDIPNCLKCNTPLIANIKTCKGCNLVNYCNLTCQKAHWSIHKRKCQLGII
ncbi:MAG: hypothetical protein Harvfovirus79_5 [Harvfovirus sp.]|uniref:MYND-type domain-containing protein n=1 Tax=Harvfovirus sp. TaxID=2487768 RepID=A0A3G5A3X4_9VIRU|nr:MAG: hypothetical protein Harvfovirus79_5 [Harvfovirus sp.]